MSGTMALPRVPSRAQLALRRYEASWLPPMSSGALIGMTLFFVFIGGAMKSALPDLSTPSALTHIELQEEAWCRGESNTLASVATNLDNDNATIPRILYIQPYGGLGSRLRAVASGLAIGKEVGAEVVIAWKDLEYGFAGAWQDLFAEPKLSLGCFPGQVLRPTAAKCKVHKVIRREEWLDLQNKWETTVVNGQLREVLCVESTMYLTAKQRELRPFYQKLVPSQSAKAQADAFMAATNWSDPNTVWVGLHVRRTDLRLRCSSLECREGVPVAEALPLSHYTSLMKDVHGLMSQKHSNMRFYIATDDAEAEAALRAEMDRWLNEKQQTRGIQSPLLPGYGVAQHDSFLAANAVLPTVVSMPKATRDGGAGWLAVRSTVSGLQEAVADLFLLSKTKILIGTVGSTFSQCAAHLMDRKLVLTAGSDFELKA